MIKYVLAAGITIAAFTQAKKTTTLASPSTPLHSVKYSIDAATSKLEWKATKKMGQHVGTMKVKSGYVNNTHGRLTSGEFVFDIKSLDITDVTDAKDKKTILDELNAPEFFNVATYPTAKFVLKEITSENRASGNLTIKGKTHLVSFPIKKTITPNKITITAEYFEIDRGWWNLKFDNFIKEGMVNDKVSIKFKIDLKR